MNEFIPYGRQNISNNDIQAVTEVLYSDYLTTGPKVNDFEAKLAKYCGSGYSVAFNSGTSALHASYYAAGLNRDDEVVTSPMTFAATSNAALFLDAVPVFADIEPDSGNINPDLIEQKISEKTKLIAPVHYAGHSCSMSEIKEIADKYNLIIVEDASHALGSSYDNNKFLTKTGSCTFSDMCVFSFHPVKHITTGEGGAVLTNNPEFYEKLKMFRNHGITKENSKLKNLNKGNVPPWYYEMQFLGYNYRMSDIHAALGISQLDKIDDFIKRRRQIAEKYNEIFRDNDFFDCPVEKDYAYHAYHLYPIRLKNGFESKKIELFNRLKNKNIGTQVHYIPVYLHPYYRNLGYDCGICPESEKFYHRELSLPIFPGLEMGDINYIAKNVLNILESL